MSVYPPIKAAASASTGTPSAFSHAVSRSAELLSCAKTAIKIAKSQYNKTRPTEPPPPGVWWNINPSQLRLHDVQQQPYQTSSSSEQQHQVLEDGIALLRTMDAELKQLEALVRRRGQTNDPTAEITRTVNRLQDDTQELKSLIQMMIPPRARGQRKRHWEVLQQWFQSNAQQQAARLKDILKVRGTVLAEQAKRRGRFQATAVSSASRSAVKHKQMLQQSSPLFKAPPPPPAVKQRTAPQPPASVPTVMNGSNGSSGAMSSSSSQQQQAVTSAAAATFATPAATQKLQPPLSRSAPPSTTGNTNLYGSRSSMESTTAAAAASYYGSTQHQHLHSAGYGGGGYGSGSGGGGGGYGGGSYYHHHHPSSIATTGMRQRRTAATQQEEQQQQEQDYQQAQLLQRQQERQTVQRLHEARQAEKSLSVIETLFGKMTTLIVQQNEVIDKIEDDVESAHADVRAGQDEITVLYELKKGNRPLILKVFGLLIFFIVFMRFYKGK